MPVGAPKGNHNHTKHGMRHTRIYAIWRSMRQRCQNPNCCCYSKYGERGIAVCEEWNDFPTFLKWAMDNGYRDDLTIDRIDVNGNYCPENCRWATRTQQANNKRNTKYLKVKNSIKSFHEWSKETGIKQTLISARIQKGVPPELIFVKKLSQGRIYAHPIVCVETGISYSSIMEAVEKHNGNSWIRNVVDTKYTACGYHWKTDTDAIEKKTNWNLQIINGKQVYVASA